MVDVGKREDRLLDRLSDYLAAIDLTRMQIDVYRNKGLTEREIEMLNCLEKLLELKRES